MDNNENTGGFENISELIGSVLSDPDSAAKLRDTARQLGLTLPAEPSVEPDAGRTAPPISAPALSALAPALGKLAPLLGKLNEEDDMTRLLHALRPYLSGARLKRAEEADRIVSVMRVLPLLRQTGENH
jgi:hypothetical protein